MGRRIDQVGGVVIGAKVQKAKEKAVHKAKEKAVHKAKERAV